MLILRYTCQVPKATIKHGSLSSTLLSLRSSKEQEIYLRWRYLLEPEPHFVGAIWYKQVLSAADCSDVKAVKPDGYATAKDRLTWAVVVDGSATFSVSYGTEDVKLAVGLNFGEFDLKEGPQRVVLRSNGAVVGTASGGACTYTWCP